MYCPNCGNLSGREDCCEYCGFEFERKEKNSGNTFHFPVLPLLFLILLSLLLIALAVNYLSLDGLSSSVISKDYSTPEELLYDYLTYARQEKARFVLSLYHNEIIKYYSKSLKNNEDIWWAVDRAYRDDVYSSYEFFIIDRQIEWTSLFYQGELEKYNIDCSAGRDVRVIFEYPSSGRMQDKYYFELVQENGFWYILSVYK